MTIEIKKDQKTNDAQMADCGTQYFSTFKYRVEGDEEFSGEDEWRDGQIVYQTTDDWKREEQRVAKEYVDNEYTDGGFLDDESIACDWDELEIITDDGAIITGDAADEIKKALEL